MSPPPGAGMEKQSVTESIPMRLYYLAGSCALAPHIALEHSASAYELVRIERGRNFDPAYLAVNPTGLVPALIDDDGSLVTENIAVLLAISRRLPQARLTPSLDSSSWIEMIRWMSFIASTLHPAFAMLWRTSRFTSEPRHHERLQRSAAQRIFSSFDAFDNLLAGRPHIAGDAISLADFYLFAMARWGFALDRSTRSFPHLFDHTLRLAALPSVRRALEQEEVPLEGGPPPS
jgi:glutathione S-transferase